MRGFLIAILILAISMWLMTTAVMVGFSDNKAFTENYMRQNEIKYGGLNESE